MNATVQKRCASYDFAVDETTQRTANRGDHIGILVLAKVEGSNAVWGRGEGVVLIHGDDRSGVEIIRQMRLVTWDVYDRRSKSTQSALYT